MDSKHIRPAQMFTPPPPDFFGAVELDLNSRALQWLVAVSDAGSLDIL